MNQHGAELWDNGVRFGYFPLSNERVYWFATIVTTDPTAAPEATSAALAKRYRDFTDPVSEFIAATADETIIRTSLADLPVLDQWSRGRVTLLGDAAHAMTPNLAQGSAQAMEDAVVLAKSIANYGSNQRALSAYETHRKDRADSILRRSRVQGRLAQVEHSVLTKIRNAAFRYTPASLLRTQMESMFAVDF